MSLNKQAMSDDMLDNVNGGTMIPRSSQDGETLNSFAARLNAQNDWGVTAQKLIAWNGLDTNADPNAPLPAGTVLKVFF